MAQPCDGANSPTEELCSPEPGSGGPQDLEEPATVEAPTPKAEEVSGDLPWEAPKETLSGGTTTYRVERTPGKGFKWATCQVCEENIMKDKLRLGSAVGNGYTKWVHLACISVEHVSAIIETAGDVQNILGFAQHAAEIKYTFGQASSNRVECIDDSDDEPLVSQEGSKPVIAAPMQAFSYFVERTPKKGFKWAKCQECKQDIVKDQLRLGSSNAGAYTKWLHLACISARHVQEVNEKAGGIEKVSGFAELGEELQDAFMSVEPGGTGHDGVVKLADEPLRKKAKTTSVHTVGDALTYKVEQAPSKGFKWAKCQACSHDILKGQLRVGSLRGTVSNGWWHLSCVSDGPRADIVRTDDATKIFGFSQLSASQKDEVQRALGA